MPLSDDEKKILLEDLSKLRETLLGKLNRIQADNDFLTGLIFISIITALVVFGLLKCLKYCCCGDRRSTKYIREDIDVEMGLHRKVLLRLARDVRHLNEEGMSPALDPSQAPTGSEGLLRYKAGYGTETDSDFNSEDLESEEESTDFDSGYSTDFGSEDSTDLDSEEDGEKTDSEESCEVITEKSGESESGVKCYPAA